MYISTIAESFSVISPRNMNTLKKNVELKSQSVFLRCSEKHQSDQCPLKTIKNQVPLRNWTGFCADTSKSMMRYHNSVAKLISDNYPWVVVVKCGCHSIHLCALYACKKLTKTLEDFCSHVYCHFSMSAKRVAVLQEFQDSSATPDHKILAPGQTRWMSLQTCVRRILEQWSALSLYFTSANFDDPTHCNKLAISALKNPFMKVLMMLVD